MCVCECERHVIQLVASCLLDSRSIVVKLFKDASRNHSRLLQVEGGGVVGG